MSVHPMRRWAQGAVFSTVGALALIACDDPEQNTSLRPEGAPIVLSVLVGNDPSGFGETATFCRPGDEKRPGFVAVLGDIVCPEDDLSAGAETVTDANPLNPYVRFQFDELLNTQIQVLTELPDADTGEPSGVFTGSIAAADPFVVTCNGVVVEYDGYYNPAGNSVTWPVGPSLVVAPLDPTTIPTGASCTVAIRAGVVLDKQGEAATDTQAFEFAVAGLEFLGSDPEPVVIPEDPNVPVPRPAVISPTSPVSLFFNGFAEVASLTPGEVRIETVADCTAAVGSGTAVPAIIAGETGTILVGTVAGAEGPEFAPDTTYILTFTAGAEVADTAGGTAELPEPTDFTLCFITDEA